MPARRRAARCAVLPRRAPATVLAGAAPRDLRERPHSSSAPRRAAALRAVARAAPALAASSPAAASSSHRSPAPHRPRRSSSHCADVSRSPSHSADVSEEDDVREDGNRDGSVMVLNLKKF